jgi:hypothetical protein
MAYAPHVLPAGGGPDAIGAQVPLGPHALQEPVQAAPQQ